MSYDLPNSETITRLTMENRITLLVYENHSAPTVVVNGSLDAGSIYEAPGRNGLASMTAAALMRGTQRRDFDTLYAELEGMGADLDFTCGVNQVNFSGKALAEDLSALIDITADVIRSPIFPDDQVERLRGERLTGLRYLLQDSRFQAGRIFRETLYPENHAYHYSVRGTLETVPTLTAEELREFHRNFYGPRHMTLVVVGDVQPTDVLNTVATAFADWENPQQPPKAILTQIDPPATTQQAKVSIADKSQTNLVLGTLGPERLASDFQAANLANSILGVFGMMGRVGDVVREREGLAYYAGSRLSGGFGQGAWSISAGVDPVNVQRTVDLIVDEIRQITSEPVSADDLADNQAYFTGHLPLQLEHNYGIAATLHFMENFDLGMDYLLTYHDQIYSLTPDDLLAAAQRYLNPDALVIATAGP